MIRKRKFYLFISILLAAIPLVLIKTYRPYIYSHKIEDFHLADTIPNIFAVPACLFLGYAIKANPSKNIGKDIFEIIIGVVIYELFFSLTLDIYDMIASVISGILLYLLLSVFYNK